jgi:hypothetical protein
MFLGKLLKLAHFSTQKFYFCGELLTKDETIILLFHFWLPYAALIVGRSVFGGLCSQLNFTGSVKFNYRPRIERLLSAYVSP